MLTMTYIAILVLCVLLMLALSVVVSRSNISIERRKRFIARMRAEAIAREFKSGSLTMPQAINRLREIEVPLSGIDRILGLGVEY